MKAANPRLARTFAVAALLAGALAAWLVSDYTGSLANRAGRPVRVLVAAGPIVRGQEVTAAMAGSAITERSVPRAYAPADAVTSADRLSGTRAITDIARGAYLTQSLFVSGGVAAGYRLRRGERAVTIDAKVSPDGADPQPGASVDIFASGFGGGSSTSLELAAAELLVAGRPAADRAQQRLTLRVSATQVPALIRGDVFARELRAVVRP